MKNIAFYFESSEATGGVNRVASNIASALADRGYKVHIISRYGGRFGRFTDDKRIVFHELFRKFHSKYLTAPLEAIKIRRLVRREKIDIVVSTGGVFFALAQFAPAIHVEWDHVSFWHGDRFQQYCRRLSARKASAVITLTEDNRAAFHAIPGRRAQIVTIHNPAFFIPQQTIDPANKTIISIGFLARQKGFDLLLQAWATIEPTVRDGWQLLIAGGDEGDGPMLERMITDLGLSEVKLLGFRNDIPTLLSQSSIYVMSSRWEGLPMVLLEAQSYGLPIVSFDCKTGPSEIITADNGILVEPETPLRLGEALAALMQDEDRRTRMSNAAMENIKRFSPDIIVQQWVDLIETL